MEEDKHILGLVQKANITDFHFYLLRWIVRHNVTFVTVENEDFQGILTAINKSVSNYLVRSGSTICNWVEEKYLYAMLEIEKVLASSFSKIYISFDLWISPNGYVFYGIVAHFVR